MTNSSTMSLPTPPSEDTSTARPHRTTMRLTSGPDHARATPGELLRVSRLELRRLVQRLVASSVPRVGRRRPLVEPTTLVNEVARRLLGSSGVQELPCRGDFYADMAIAFRGLLRDRAAHGLPDDEPLWLAPLGLGSAPKAGPLDAALRRLEQRSPRHAQIAVLRLLGGMTDAEIAEQMSLSERRVAAGWQSARVWLERKLAAG